LKILGGLGEIGLKVGPRFFGGRATAQIPSHISVYARLEYEVVGCGDELVRGIGSTGGISSVDGRFELGVKSFDGFVGIKRSFSCAVRWLQGRRR
jgi:hypothetical protein